jgi:hypothetical protein
MDIDLGYRQVSRSACAHQTADLTAVYLGTCDEHQRPVSHKGTASRAPGAGHYYIQCPEDGGHQIVAERLAAVTTETTCDGSCMGAWGPHCDCGCGGANHGKSWGVTSTRAGFESALLAYRAAQARTEAKRVQRKETAERKARQAFDAWAAENAGVVEALKARESGEHPGSSDFLTDLARQLTRGKPLTPDQCAAAERAISRLQASQAQQQARDAARRPCPEGKVTISGTIVKVTVREGYMGATEMKATVACDGYAVWVTLPRVLVNWAMENRRSELWGGWTPGPDCEGGSRRWTQALRDTTVRFTATVERSQRDESFGFAKRPVQVTFKATEKEGTAE